ncbi:MAG TPA: hypothetical protein VNK82_00655 [Terriglobales bacterium]|nr:hypothetical protein [Terriglobales bacterium]
MKKLSLVIVLLWAGNAHAGLFNHVIKPVGKAVVSASVAASKAVAGGGSTAAKAAAEGSTTVARASGKAVKKVVV